MSLRITRPISMCACLAVATICGLAQSVPAHRKQVDLHSAIALSQAHSYGTTGLTGRPDLPGSVADVLLLVSEPQWTAVRGRLAARGMTIRFEDARSGYVRVTVPFADVRQLFEWPEIDAVRVDGLAGFDTKLQPQVLRTSVGFLEADDLVPASADVKPELAAKSARKPLTAAIARRYPVNTDRDMGVIELRAANPTFDGRGVGIGVIEGTWLPIDQPAFAEARALDGTPRRKVLRYLDGPWTRAEGLSASLSEWFDCRTAICTVKERAIRLPSAGRYRLANFLFVSPAPAGCRGLTFAILQAHDRGRLYVDTNRDFDFLDEKPIVDFNGAGWEANSIVPLRCQSGQPAQAVVTIDSDGRFARLHPFHVSHVTMTTTVAAGSEVDANLAVGVAPNASLVVIESGPFNLFSEYLEGGIALARDPDVDLIFAALVIQTPLGTSESFDARAFDRISERYNKPILISAGNSVTALAVTPAPGGRLAMAVGQYISSATTEALLGVKRPEVTVVSSAAGPAWDGASRPDFIAASRRLAAYPCTGGQQTSLTDQFTVPLCYALSGGTSAASPSAAGAVALLISAAKQRGLTPSVAEIREALLASARLMPGLPAYAQGAGLIDVSRAWQYLQRPSRAPRLTIEGELRHAFVDFLGAAKPRGLFWMARSGERERLALTLHPQGGETGRLSVQTRGDLELSVADSIATSTTTRVPVTINPPALGRVASSWITFADETGVAVGQTLATAVRPAPLAAPSYQYGWKEEVEIETHSGTVFTVPAGTTGMLVEVDRLRGDAQAAVSRPLGAVSLWHLFWSGGRSFSGPTIQPIGRAAGVFMNPAAGDWGVANIERSTIRPGLPTPPERASVSIRLTAFRTSCSLVSRAIRDSSERISVTVEDVFAKPVNGGALLAPATVQTERFALRDEFERRPVDIIVKPGTAAFHVSSGRQGATPIMLQLFDCTQGHCIPLIQSIPGEPAPALNVRQPHAGLWRVFAVPLQPGAKTTDVELTITQALETNFTVLAPVAGKGRSATAQVYEEDVPAAADSPGYLLLRTDERAKVNKEGWGAISVCSIQATPQSR